MDVTDALERINAIHSHLARGEEYRGYQPLSLAVSGLMGLLAAFMQPWLVGEDDPSGFVRYWIGMGLLCAVLASSGTLINYIRREGVFARRRTHTVLRQMLPSLLVGTAVTLACSRPEQLSHSVVLLPGLWSLIYGLGAIASLPYLPRLAGCIAVWYLVAGAILLLSVEGPVPSAWSVGLPFGCGQLLAAGVLSIAPRPEIEP